MFSDPRFLACLQAAEAMRHGEFRPPLPPDDVQDDVGRLSAALRALGDVMERKFREMETLYHVTERINSGILLEDILEYVYASFRGLIPYDRLAFAVLEEDGRQARAEWCRTNYPRVRLRKGYSADLQSSSLRRVLESGRPRILNDLEDYVQENPDSLSTRLMLAEGIRSSLTCPLIASGRPVGFLFFSSRAKDTYRDLHTEMFQQIAGQLSVTVEKGRLYDRLVDLNRLKDRYVGIAAHDLRSPIGTVQGFTRLLRDGVESGERASMLDIIDRTCTSMLLLIDDLLCVNAIESGRLAVRPMLIELGPFLQAYARNAAMLAEPKSILLEAEIHAALPDVVVDPKILSRVLDNLVSNAIKFSRPHTTIVLSANGSGEHVQIRVADQGVGIPADQMPLLFSAVDRVRVRPTAGESSTGLGLAIVKRLVEAHGGNVFAHSEMGEGSTFGFILPRCGPPAQFVATQ